MEPPAHAILRDDFECRTLRPEVATEAEAPKERVISQHGACTAQRTAEAQIDFTGVIPRPAPMRLLEPRIPERCGLKPATRSTIVRDTGKPVAIVGLGSPRVEQRP